MHPAVWAVCVAVLLVCCATWACDTPVYRYAMYNWPPAPYRVYYLHGGQPAQEDQQVNRLLAQRDETSPNAANVIFQVLDLSDKGRLEQLPEPIQKAWQSRGDGRAAIHVVFNPWGNSLFLGRLDPASVPAILDSPARTRLGELLMEGHAVVLLILAAPDAERNQQAEKVVDQVIADAAANQVPVDSPDGAPGFSDPVPAQAPGGPSDDDARRPSSGLKVARLTVSRTDPAETWLVRSLLAVEPDLADYADEPVVFAVYGRGRVMPPCVGKGITADNLTACVAFLAAACSCMIKDENPGVDLIMAWDWEATATALAADDKDLDGGQLAYREIMPGGPERELAAAAPGTRAEAALSASAQTAGAAGPAGPSSSPGDLTPAGARDPAPRVSPPAESIAVADKVPAETFAGRQMRTYGIGVAVLALAVLSAGLMLIRRKHSGDRLP